ncbi:MAG: 50S ribosomal protein L15 [Chloroflexi bacterium]|nr:50S ribosomal protein L15 [Chloroflexota bacterium]
MRQDQLSPPSGSKSNRKRVGRGDGSNRGNYSGKGCKGQKSRSGCKIRPGFEGGQLPIIKRLPRKRGFTNIFRKENTIVRLETLNIFETGSVVKPEMMLEKGIIKSLKNPVKILAEGKLEKALTVKADKFSQQAKEQIESAGGKVEEIGSTETN